LYHQATWLETDGPEILLGFQDFIRSNSFSPIPDLFHFF